MKVSNCKARSMVQSKLPFKGNNTFGETINGAYVVFSYGHHWPLFLYVDGTWYENRERYSVSTSKHRSQLHPLTETEQVSPQEIRKLAGL